MSESTLGVLLLLVVSPLLGGCMGLLGPERNITTHVGEHAVGVTTIHVDDESRDRELDVEVWYPAKRIESEREPEVYRLRAAGTTVARLRTRTGARRNATPLAAKAGHPVVLLSHGAGSSRYGNMSLCEVLASHGFIVAAPDHAGHTTADKVFGISEDERARSAYDRPIDLSEVLDELSHRNRDHHSILAGLVDLKRVGVAGHSFGGRTALGLVGARFDGDRQQRDCERDPSDRRCRALAVFGAGAYRYRDPRVKAALLITPAGFDFYRSDGIAAIDAPVLVVGAGRDQTTPYTQFHRPVFEALRGPRYLLDLRDAGHLTATDVCDVVDSIGFLAKAVGGAQAQDGCGVDATARDVALERVVAASLPFFDLYLNEHRAAEAVLQAVLHEAGGAVAG